MKLIETDWETIEIYVFLFDVSIREYIAFQSAKLSMSLHSRDATNIMVLGDAIKTMKLKDAKMSMEFRDAIKTMQLSDAIKTV